MDVPSSDGVAGISTEKGDEVDEAALGCEREDKKKSARGMSREEGGICREM